MCVNPASPDYPSAPVAARRKYVGWHYAGFSYQAKRGERKHRVVAMVGWHSGELFPPVGVIVSNLPRQPERAVALFNQRDTVERHLEEGKNAIDRTPLFCRVVRAKAVGPRLRVLAYDLTNFTRPFCRHDEPLCRSVPVADWTAMSYASGVRNHSANGH